MFPLWFDGRFCSVMTAEAAGAGFTVNVAVAPVELSLTVNVPAVLPLVSVTVACVLSVIFAALRAQSAEPVTVNRSPGGARLAEIPSASLLHRVFVPVIVSACVPLTVPLDTDSEIVGVPMVVVAATEPVTPSVRVRVPVAPDGGVATAGGVRTTV